MENKRSFDVILTVIVVVLVLIAIGIFFFRPNSDNKVNTTEVEHVVLDREEITLKVNDTYNFNPIVSPSTAINKTLTYESSNPTIATVDNTGLGSNFLETMGAKSIIVPNYHADSLPSQTMRNRIQEKGIKLYRQSDSSTGNILVKSDGKNVTIKMNISAKDYA